MLKYSLAAIALLASTSFALADDNGSRRQRLGRVELCDRARPGADEG